VEQFSDQDQEVIHSNWIKAWNVWLENLLSQSKQRVEHYRSWRLLIWNSNTKNFINVLKALELEKKISVCVDTNKMYICRHAI
jgi:hypothetical protein